MRPLLMPHREASAFAFVEASLTAAEYYVSPLIAPAGSMSLSLSRDST